MRRKQDCRPYAGRRRPVWRRAAALLLLAALVAFGVLEAVVLSGGRTQIQGQPEIMVIFGCQVKPDGPSALLRDRLDTALDYLEGHPDLTVVVTGGQDNTVTKAITDPIFEAAVNTKITTHLDVPRGTHSLGAGEFGNDPDVQNSVVEATVHFFADQMK